ncbi:MAG: hypothetical protein AAGI30_06970 [Planctomycetota bacterium]
MNRAAPALACAACALTLNACAGDQRGDLPTLGTPPDEPAGFRFPEDDSPIVAGDPLGIDVHIWATPDEDGSVDQTLAELGADTGDAAEGSWGSEAWRASGVTFAVLPGEALVDLRRRFPQVLLGDRNFLRAATRWEEIYRGGPLGDRAVLVVAGESVRTDAGTPRLLGRAWFGPANVRGRVRGAVRLQLAAQLDQDREIERFPLEAPTELPEAGEAGPPIGELVLAGELVPGRLYLMTADAPAPSPPEAEADLAGPQAPTTPTLGQALFTGITEHAGGTTYRILMAIVPRGPERFSLID